MSLLTAKEIGYQLNSVPNWTKRGQAILRTFKFEGFLKSVNFVNLIGRKAQMLNHHPDIDIRYDRVTLTLSTHEVGGITEKDFFLARQCDEVFTKFFLAAGTPIPIHNAADVAQFHPVRERGGRARAA